MAHALWMVSLVRISFTNATVSSLVYSRGFEITFTLTHSLRVHIVLTPRGLIFNYTADAWQDPVYLYQYFNTISAPGLLFMSILTTAVALIPYVAYQQYVFAYQSLLERRLTMIGGCDCLYRHNLTRWLYTTEATPRYHHPNPTFYVPMQPHGTAIATSAGCDH